MECITYIIIPCHIYSYFERPSVASNFFMEGITYIYITCYIYSYFERLSVASNIFNGRHNIYNWDNYNKPTYDMARFHFAYPWFKTLHFANLNFNPLPIHYPALLKLGVNMYFIFTFMSLSSKNKK